ncbi:hypothetical protein PCANC_27363 [Puccinia coronata f. sp. avenae]|uniref:Uncharacterized protein n=1 Tax=Puccinia coronata f. sp. avenae TaxID=200324 RepID=A0A2N5SCU4_9BASI|nr:hypothetical protein PCANC_27363 [Puccinia coronata f. sp. avenae]
MATSNFILEVAIQGKLGVGPTDAIPQPIQNREIVSSVDTQAMQPRVPETKAPSIGLKITNSILNR